jgi:hypothetical protein
MGIAVVLGVVGAFGVVLGVVIFLVGVAILGVVGIVVGHVRPPGVSAGIYT